MKWRSAEVETAIAESKEVLGAYSVSLNTDGLEPWKPLPLKRALPRKTYERWAVQRDKYIGPRFKTEHLLPAVASLFLLSRAYEANGLTSTDEVWRSIYGLARLHYVPVRPQDFEIQPNPQEAVSQREARRAGAAFMEQTLDRLETNIAESSRRANAWADGDMTALRKLASSDETYAESFAASWPFLSRDEVARIIESEDTRLAALFERALDRNRTTFAALPVYLLMKQHGALSILAAAGCDVRQPDE